MKRTNMQRLSITLPTQLLEFLKDDADKLGISVAELMRRIADAYRDRKQRQGA